MKLLNELNINMKLLNDRQAIWLRKKSIWLSLGHSERKLLKTIPITFLGCDKRTNKGIKVPRKLQERHYSVASFSASSAIAIDVISKRSHEYSLQTNHVYSTLKRRGNGRFHVVSTWNTRDVFVGMWLLLYCITFLLRVLISF